MSVRDLLMAAAGAVAPGGASYRYWRIFITATQSPSQYGEIAEIEFRATPGGADLTTGSTPVTESSYLIVYDGEGEIFAYYPGINTVDGTVGNPYSVWYPSASPTVGTPQWLRYDLVTAKEVSQIAINNYTGGGSSLKDFKVQGSADGSSWTDVKSFTAVAAWTGWQAFNLT